MRRACLLAFLTLLIAPAAALAASGGAGMGSLAVSGANGTLTINGNGVIYGRLDQGTLWVFSYRPASFGSALSVDANTVRNLSGVTAYSGSNLRFLVPAGSYIVYIVGSGIDVSAVGRGTLSATAATTNGVLTPIGRGVGNQGGFTGPQTASTTTPSASVPTTSSTATTATSTTSTTPSSAVPVTGGTLAVDGNPPIPFSQVVTPTYFGVAST